MKLSEVLNQYKEAVMKMTHLLKGDICWTTVDIAFLFLFLINLISRCLQVFKSLKKY